MKARRGLIIICSPNSARSIYVNEEIRRFKALSRSANVIPVIIDGEPGDVLGECFPPALRFKLDGHGVLTSEREEPIAADARAAGDGKKGAVLKVAAGLLGIGLDEIIRRDKRGRRRRTRFFISAVTVIVALVAVGAFGWWRMHYFFGELQISANLNSVRDAADVCEDASTIVATKPIIEARRILLASECVDTFVLFIDDLPAGTPVPNRVLASFQRYLAMLRTFKTEQKLSPEQVESLSKAETLAKLFSL